MKTNARGFALIRRWEGLELKAYLCPARKWTIGYGHTKGVYPGMRITEVQADELLRGEIHEYESGVAGLVNVPLTDNQFSALVSFAYNLGLAALRGSTLLRKLNAGDYEAAAGEFLRWNKADGRIMTGLTRRRLAERNLFLTPPDEVPDEVV